MVLLFLNVNFGRIILKDIVFPTKVVLSNLQLIVKFLLIKSAEDKWKYDNTENPDGAFQDGVYETGCFFR